MESEQRSSEVGSPAPRSLRLRVAGALDTLGLLGLPLGLGAVLGYWASDRGTRWLPDMLEGLIVLGVVSLLMMLVGMRLRRGHVVTTEGGQRLRKRVALIFVLLLVAALGWLWKDLAQQPSPLTSLSPQEFGEAFDLDSRRFREHDRGFESLLSRLESEAMLNERAGTVLRASDEELLLDAWGTARDYTTALEGLRLLYEDWYRFDPSRQDRPRMLRSFLLSYGAEVALAEHATRLGRAVRSNPDARKFLDSPHPEHGLPADAMTLYSEAFEGSEGRARLLAGAQYLRWMDEVMGWRGDAWEAGLGWLWTDIEDALDRLVDRGIVDGAALLVAGDGQFLRRQFRRVWMPSQQEVAQWFGDTKLRRVGWYLITEPQQEVLDQELEPGDLLITRKNWYMSNVGLPGWWPHGILYIGSPEKLGAWADDPEVRGLLEELAGEPTTLGDYLAARHPRSWQRYSEGDGEHPYRVIEAISPGVVLNSLAHCSGDSLAALRPRVSKRAKAHAIVQAFGHLDKPYDFDFDFATDHALVCTELIWRSYRSVPGVEGLDLPLFEVAGRRTLPAIEIVRLYIEQRESPERLFDFVYFLDAREEEERSLVSTEAAFVTTPDRGKWGFAD